MTLKEIAVSYAQRGWYVVPLFSIVDGKCDCGRPDNICSPPSKGKHPRLEHGLRDASNDPEQVAYWWELFPAANIGIVAGKSRLVVMDVDPRNGGLKSAEDLAKEHGAVPKTWMAATGGGGVHYLFAHPGGNVGNRSGIRPGIDLKGDGGYFVAPPSNHLSGKTYAWIIDPDSGPLAACPAWLLPAPDLEGIDIHGPLPALQERTERALRYLSKIPGAVSGQSGHDQTWGAALSLVRGFALPSDVAFELLWNQYNPRCEPPWSEKELKHKIEDAQKARVPDGFKVNGSGSAPAMESPAETLVDESDIPKSLPELRARAKELEAMPKTLFGLKPLDDLVGGFRPGWTAVLGAFAGGGKTTLVTFAGVSFASRGHPVLILTNELSEFEVTSRIDVALEAPSDLPTLKVWSPQGDIFKVIEGAKKWLDSVDGSELTPVILADYLQKFRSDPKEKARERQVAIIAESFQRLGRQTACLNILAAQLNRQSQNEETPKLHHLRESGLIEQVADVAILLSKPSEEAGYFEVAKHRWGRSGGSVTLNVDWARARYGPMTEAQKWAPLGQAIRKYILESGQPSVKVREVSQNVTNRPKKDEIIKASQATGWFTVVDSDVFLRPG